MIVILIIAVVILVLLLKHTKILKNGTLTLCTGGVKTGKTTLTVHMALRQYKRNLIKWYIRKYLFFKREEKPLLYSNIPLRCKYVPLTTKLLERKERFNYKSVILISEVSLIADSMSYKIPELNESLLMFCKLIGHETRGGSVFIDTQAIGDCHYAFKRVLNSYLYIDKAIKWLPFVILLKVREERYSDDGQTVNIYDKDISENVDKFVLIPKRVWKKFDTYCYSILTDNLNSDVRVVDKSKSNNLKAEKIVTFKISTISEKNKGVLKNAKKNN